MCLQKSYLQEMAIEPTPFRNEQTTDRNLNHNLKSEMLNDDNNAWRRVSSEAKAGNSINPRPSHGRPRQGLFPVGRNSTERGGGLSRVENKNVMQCFLG